jgi:hypothetical protein
MHRQAQGYAKDHWTDAACVGEAGAAVFIPKALTPFLIKAVGRGHRQMVLSDKYGFPRGKARSRKEVAGFRTGDFVRLTQPSGKYAGVYVGRLATIRASGQFDIITARGKITASHRNFQLLQRGDGYAYTLSSDRRAV